MITESNNSGGGLENTLRKCFRIYLPKDKK